MDRLELSEVEIGQFYWRSYFHCRYGQEEWDIDFFRVDKIEKGKIKGEAFTGGNEPRFSKGERWVNPQDLQKMNPRHFQ